MTEREKFERWWWSLTPAYRITFQTNEVHWAGWQARQPEIDILTTELYVLSDKITKTEDALCVAASSLHVLNKMVWAMAPGEAETEASVADGTMDEPTARLFKLMLEHVAVSMWLLDRLREQNLAVEAVLANIDTEDPTVPKEVMQ